MTEIERFLNLFDLAARQAGFVARHLQEEVSLRTKKGENSPESEALTVVDLAAQDVILSLLHSEFSQCAVDAEELTETAALFEPYSPDKPLIVVDPIDGTLNYGLGSSEYAVMAAWLQAERYRAALVHFPAFQETYRARQGGGCRREDNQGSGPIRASSRSRRVLVSPRVPNHYRSALADIGFEVAVSRCSAVDTTAPLAGRAAASISLGEPDRRRAIGYFLTLEAGGVVRIGDRWWKGEDPLSLPAGPQLAVVAGDRDTAERILETVA